MSETDVTHTEPLGGATKKYLVLDGNRRVTALRELALDGHESARYVRAKILPPEVSLARLAILMEKRHGWGSQMRCWAG